MGHRSIQSTLDETRYHCSGPCQQRYPWGSAAFIAYHYCPAVTMRTLLFNILSYETCRSEAWLCQFGVAPLTRHTNCAALWVDGWMESDHSQACCSPTEVLRNRSKVLKSLFGARRSAAQADQERDRTIKAGVDPVLVPGSGAGLHNTQHFYTACIFLYLCRQSTMQFNEEPLATSDIDQEITCQC